MNLSVRGLFAESSDVDTGSAVARPAPRGAPPWALYAVLGAIVTVAYPLLHRAGHVGWTDALYAVFAVLTACAIFAGVHRHRPAARTAWLLLAGGQLVFAVGDVIYVVQHSVLHIEQYPGIGDWLYLASYPVTAAGLVALIRRRTPGWHLASLIDAAILATGAGVLFWVYLITPLAESVVGYDLATKVVSVAYPVMDLLVLAVALFLVLGAGIRPPAYYLLCAGLTANLLTDVVYAYQSIQGTYAGGLLDCGWLLAYTMLAVAALHPSMRRLDERSPVAAPDATWSRLAALAAASLAAPTVLAVQYARGAALHVPVVIGASALLFLLVLARMAGLVAEQRKVAITDGLTGLHTRRFFEESLRMEAERAARHGVGFGVLLFDVDHFKSVNDSFGHPGGDRVLCEVARRLRAACRSGDVVARYGGEEFGVLLPGASARDMATIAENMRAAVAGTPIAVDGRSLLPITISGGTAALPADGHTAAEVVLAADRALYEAKNAGRNRIVLSGALSPAPITA
jgi:diguanylate cyclase (GGDEF)-like protein